MKLTQLIISIGLALDIIGAVFLAKGFMAKKIQRIIDESRTYFGGNRWLKDSLLQQKLEAQIGLVFLFSGFLCQAIGNFISIPKEICLSPYIIFSILLFSSIILFLAFLFISKYLFEKKRIWSEAFCHKDKLDEYKSGSLDICGKCLNIEREDNEDDDVYKKRIAEKINKILKNKDNEIALKYKEE